MLVPKYYDQWADCMEDYLNGNNKDLWRSIETGPYYADLFQAIGNTRTAEDMIAQGNKKK